MMKIMKPIALVTLMFVTACSSSKPETDDFGLPKDGSYKGGYKVGKPYTINGKTYYPQENVLYDETGVASWYGPGFDGKMTANGEIFDQTKQTAAHPTLPMPSIVRVTNLENGRTIKVRINDRGPFHSNRIIDLSKRSAEMLGITGLAKVRVVYVKEDTDKLRSGLGIAPETYPTLASLEGQAQDQAVQQSGSRIIESKAPIQEIQSRDISSNDLPPPSSPRSANTTPTTTIQEDVATMAEEYERATSSSGTASTNYGVPKESGVKAPNQNQGQNQGSNKDPNQYAGDFRTSGEIKPSELYNQEGQQPAQRPPQQQTNTQPNLPNKLPPQNTKVVANNSSSGVSAAQQKNAGNLASLGKYIQAGAFSVKENAYNVAQKLTGLAPVIVKLVEVNSQQLYRVRVGPFADDSTARLALQKVIEIGLKDAKIVTN